VENTGRYQNTALRNLTPKLVSKLNSVNNKTSRAVDFWLDSILGVYITKFVVDCTQSYSVVERDFFKGFRGRFIKSLGTWIKMLLCNKGMMTMEFDCVMTQGDHIYV
jgi:hypothetical protein